MTFVNNLQYLMSSIFARSHLPSNGDLCRLLLPESASVHTIHIVCCSVKVYVKRRIVAISRKLTIVLLVAVIFDIDV